MKVSVVIPVYNAEKYLESAVESALRQPETAEVVLAEDCSPDNCLAICQRLEKQHDRVRLVRHPDGKNHGAGATRNLGIESARCEFVAFLDADDYFGENRFAQTSRILDADPSLDGVYEAVGCEFENEEAKDRYFKTHAYELATVFGRFPPEELYSRLVTGKFGYIHLDGLVIRKACLMRVGMFPKLRLHQDMVLAFKLAALCRLAPGELEQPVSIRRLHLSNRITNPRTDFSDTKLQAAEHLLNWAIEQNLPAEKVDPLRKRDHWARYRRCRITKHYAMALYYYVRYRLMNIGPVGQ